MTGILVRIAGLVFICGLAFLAGCAAAPRSQVTIPWSPGQQTRQPSFAGDVVLSSQQSDLLLSEYLFLTVRFHNAGPARDFYNPGFEAAFPAPAALAVYDARHRFIGNLLPQTQTEIPTPDAWVHVDAGATVEYSFAASTDSFPGHPGMQLKAGVYTFQLVYSQAFIEPCPPAGILAGSEFSRQLARFDLMRSNPIKIRLSPLFHEQPHPQLNFDRPG